MFEIVKTKSVGSLEKEKRGRHVIHFLSCGIMKFTPFCSEDPTVFPPFTHLRLQLSEDIWVYSTIPKDFGLFIYGFDGTANFVHNGKEYKVSKGDSFYLAEKPEPQFFLFKAGQFEIIYFLERSIRLKFYLLIMKMTKEVLLDLKRF